MSMCFDMLSVWLLFGSVQRRIAAAKSDHPINFIAVPAPFVYCGTVYPHSSKY
jgi:hypothetical protein